MQSYVFRVVVLFHDLGQLAFLLNLNDKAEPPKRLKNQLRSLFRDALQCIVHSDCSTTWFLVLLVLHVSTMCVTIDITILHTYRDLCRKPSNVAASD